MKGILFNKNGELFVKYWEMRYAQHATHPNEYELPIHPDNWGLYSSLLEEKEVEFEIVKEDSEKGKKQRELHQSSKPYEFMIDKIQYAKLIYPKVDLKQETWDDIRLQCSEIGTFDTFEWLKENFKTPERL